MSPQSERILLALVCYVMMASYKVVLRSISVLCQDTLLLLVKVMIAEVYAAYLCLMCVIKLQTMLIF